MRKTNRGSLANMFRRIHLANLKSEATGIPTDELLAQDRELRQSINKDAIENSERRKFLQQSGIAAGAVVGASAMPAAANVLNNGNRPNASQPSIAVIGAGAAGMRAAHRLKQYNLVADVFEGGDRLGGRMHSSDTAFSDHVVEWGGELISTEHTGLRNLCKQLNLQLEDVNKLPENMEETYLVGGQLYTEHDLDREWQGGLYELFKRDQQAAPWQPTWDYHTAEHVRLDWLTTEEYLNQAGYSSNHWTHKLMMTNVVSEYGLKDDCPALNLIYTLGWTNRGSGGLPLAGTDERFHIVGGNNKVIQAMADQIGHDRIQTGKRLVAVRGEAQGPYTLSFQDGSEATYERLVMALPVWKNRDVDWDPRILAGMAPEKRLALQNVAGGDNGKLQLEFSSRVFNQTRTINGQEVHQSAISYSDPDEFVTTWEANPASPSEKGVLVNYTGGVRGRNLGGNEIFGPAAASDVNRLLNDFDQIWPGAAAAYTGNAIVSNWYDNPLANGSFTSPRLGHYTSWWGALFEDSGNLLFAGEGTDRETWGFMEGGILSGERVATYLAQSI
ncbi:MAG: FAD-dependent oxidoreductase [Gammaproteobacteria bacterium]|nr:FAD-dependent oxidoreductase [Gammaproteobacteria bacterium]